MTNGGYHVIDLSGVTLGTAAVNVPGLNAEFLYAAQHGKPLFITGVKTASVTWDAFIPCSIRHTAANAIYATGVNSTSTANYIVTLYVLANDNATLTMVDVTNPSNP